MARAEKIVSEGEAAERKEEAARRRAEIYAVNRLLAERDAHEFGAMRAERASDLDALSEVHEREAAERAAARADAGADGVKQARDRLKAHSAEAAAAKAQAKGALADAVMKVKAQKEE